VHLVGFITNKEKWLFIIGHKKNFKCGKMRSFRC